MARYRNELDDERDYYRREERMRRDSMGAFDEPYSSRNRIEQDWRPDYNRGRFGERAEYEHNEPRYSEQRGRFGDEGRQAYFLEHIQVVVRCGSICADAHIKSRFQHLYHGGKPGSELEIRGRIM